jgi:general secretion pathway protein G
LRRKPMRWILRIGFDGIEIASFWVLMTCAPLREHPVSTRWRSVAGFTLIELLAVIALIGVLMGIVTPRLEDFLETTKVTQAIADITVIQLDVVAYSAEHDSLPPDLATIGRGTLLDPWGNPYQYLNYGGNTQNPQGARKDRSLHPLNSDFDLYSAGADGQSVAPITAQASQDDIIRANDGGYIGLARNY